MTLLEMVRTKLRGAALKPAQAEVADVVAQAVTSALEASRPEDATAHPMMTPEERRAIGAELAQRHKAFMAECERAAAAVREAEAKRDEAVRECERAYMAAAAVDDGAYTRWRDAEIARLWAARPRLADELIARVIEESHSLKVETVEAPSRLVSQDGHYAVRSNTRGVTNRPCVEARSHALRALADDIRRGVERGVVCDEAELQRMFDTAYRKLPAIVRPVLPPAA
jgi:hypothetical protein